jgi:uncharacterized membrane protein
MSDASTTGGLSNASHAATTTGQTSGNRNRGILLVIGLVALAGMLVAIYDSASRFLRIPLFCPFAGNGCDIVQNSPYAVVLGIPLAFLGAFGFGGYIVLAYVGARAGPGARWHLYALLGLNLLEVASMAYFAYLELAVIHAVCSLCMFSAALDIALGIMIVYAIWTWRAIIAVGPV